jgi:hypothetical protein
MWRSAYVYRVTGLPYDADHGCFVVLFPDDFEQPPDPWLLNPEPPLAFGGPRDGSYVASWSFQGSRAVVARSEFRFHSGRVVLGE